jgi:hypothetical protein
MERNRSAQRQSSSTPGVDPRDRKRRAGLTRFKWLLWLAAILAAAPALATGATNQGQVQVNVNVTPIASLTFLDNPLLYLEVPPPGSTFPSNGVRFRVTGNAAAVLSAAPDDFIQIPSQGYLGKAVLNSGTVGYKIDLLFPSIGVAGSPIQISTLPGFEASGTSPLGVNLMLTGGVRDGIIHLEASQQWTADGSLPLPGVYVGHVTLTLTADNL